MEKIAVKTKIKKLELGCRKQNIEFKAFDMTSRQVANVDKIIRNNDNEYIRLTIEPEIERMEIEPIVSVVKLVAMECAGKGQHIKIAGFKAAGDKLDQINNYINNESDVIITFEQTQEKLIDETPIEENSEEGIVDSDPDSLDDYDPPADGPLVKDYQVDENGVITNPEVITVKLPKNYGTMCCMTLGRSNDNWYFGYDINVGHAADGSSCKKYGGEDIGLAIQDAKNEIFSFIDEQKNYKYAKQAKKKIEKTIEDWLLVNT